MQYFITYDIESNRIRKQCANTLERHGAVRIQKSVFFWQTTVKRLSQLCAELRHIAAEFEPRDNLLVIPVARDLLIQTVVIGNNATFADATKPPPHTLVV